MTTRPIAFALAFSLLATATFAAEPALLRLERQPGVERNALLDAGLPVVEEIGDCFLAVGDPVAVAEAARLLGIKHQLLDRAVPGSAWLVVALQGDARADELAPCGQVVHAEARWVVVRTAETESSECASSDRWFVRPLRERALGRWRQVAEPEAVFAVKPLVQEMVGSLTQTKLVNQWTDIVGVADERFSPIAAGGGCVEAANMLRDRLAGYGLESELQTYRADYAPNVVATLPGVTNPDQVYIAIGHLDDESDSSTFAPGADDNASGSAMVVTTAEIMSRYRFASTVKFLAVTGEEQGLRGSEAYATAAAAQGENILGVLNADMIAWQGDGIPAAGENLDLIYNSASSPLLTAFSQAAADYATGCPVNALLCPNMQQSDHWHFWAEGYQAVFGISDDHNLCGGGGGVYPYYHTSNDTIANCGNTAFFTAATKAYLATLAHLADPVCRVPDAPTGVSAVPDGTNRVAVSWSSAGSGLLYQVLRAPGGCSGPLRYTGVGETTGLSLVDTTASGGVTYAYVVRSVDTSCTSAYSACDEASTTGACTEPPEFGGVSSVSDDHGATCTLTVSWAAATPYCGAGTTYNVYRSTTPGFTPATGNRVASGLSGTSYADITGLVSGTTYYYVVRAVDSANGVEDANLVEESGVPSGPYSMGTWTDNAGDSGTAQLVLTSPWSVASSGGHAAPKVYATGDYGDDTCAGLATPTLHLGSGSQVTFWSKYDIETGYDKGEVQVSTNGGSSWTRVAVNYPGNGNQTGDACGLPSGQYYFTGTFTTPTYASYTGSLATWANLDVKLRWVISSDVYITESGWWVDDISITNVMVPGTCETGTAVPLFADDFETGTTDAWSSVLP